MAFVTTRPRLVIAPPPAVSVGAYEYIPETGESPSWWPLAALACVAVIAGFLWYGHHTGWT